MFKIKNNPKSFQFKSRIIKPRIIKNNYSNHDLIYTSYLVSKGIILYTMFYCSLNWLYYKEKNKK